VDDKLESGQVWWGGRYNNPSLLRKREYLIWVTAQRGEKKRRFQVATSSIRLIMTGQIFLIFIKKIIYLGFFNVFL